MTAHRHVYDEDSDCLVCGESLFFPTPDRPAAGQSRQLHTAGGGRTPSPGITGRTMAVTERADGAGLPTHSAVRTARTRTALVPGPAGRDSLAATPVAGESRTDREHGRTPAGPRSLPGSGERPEPGHPAPAGRAPSGSSVPPAGSTPQAFTITLPAGLPLLSLNDRGHWAARYRRSEAIKKAAWAMALQARVPRLERVAIIAEYQPPDRRRRDADNPVASVKAAIDGIVAAGCLPGDDSPRYVESVTCRIGEPYPRGRLVLHLTEVAAVLGDDAA